MASPNFDALNLQHSKNIGEAVAAAATNSSRWTAAQRSYHLNEAIRRLIKYHIVPNIADTIDVFIRNTGFLNPHITTEAQALSSNVKALSGWTGTASWILSAYNTTDSLPVVPVPQRIVPYTSAGGNSYLLASATNQMYTIDGGNFRLLDGVSNSTDSITLRYIKAHSDLSVGGASDIIITDNFNDWILDMAYKVAFEELPVP